jgi:hypothetical protein
MQIRQIARSIQKFGFNNAVLMSDHADIIARHGRAEAVKLLGMQSVPSRIHFPKRKAQWLRKSTNIFVAPGG